MLDWHAGLTAAFAAWGAAQGIERDWHALANEHRRRSLHRMTDTVDPGFNIDDVHRDVLGELFDEDGLGGSAEERQAIAERWHQLGPQNSRHSPVKKTPGSAGCGLFGDHAADAAVEHLRSGCR